MALFPRYCKWIFLLKNSHKTAIYININYKKINLRTYKKKLILLMPTVIFWFKIQKIKLLIF